MTNYSLRARMMILILAPTVLIGLLLSIFFVVHRYNDLQRQLEDAWLCEKNLGDGAILLCKATRDDASNHHC